MPDKPHMVSISERELARVLVERDEAIAALLHVIEGVGGAEAIVWNSDCPTCVIARALVMQNRAT